MDYFSGPQDTRFALLFYYTIAHTTTGDTQFILALDVDVEEF